MLLQCRRHPARIGCADDPVIGRRAPGAGLHGGQHLGQTAVGRQGAAEQRLVGTVNGVDVGIGQPRHGHAALQVHHLRGRADVGLDLGVAAHRNEAAATDRHGLGPGAAALGHAVDLAMAQHQVRRLHGLRMRRQGPQHGGHGNGQPTNSVQHQQIPPVRLRRLASCQGPRRTLGSCLLRRMSQMGGEGRGEVTGRHAESTSPPAGTGTHMRRGSAGSPASDVVYAVTAIGQVRSAPAARKSIHWRLAVSRPLEERGQSSGRLHPAQPGDRCGDGAAHQGIECIHSHGAVHAPSVLFVQPQRHGQVGT